MNRIKLRQVSNHKLQQYKDELPIRIKLCIRAGGEWVKANNPVGGYCRGGFCECGCGKSANYEGLHPHEKVHRGVGGKLSMKNSIMVLNSCHNKKQHNHIKREKVKRIV